MSLATCTLKDKVLGKIGKLVGCKLPETLLSDKSEIERILRNRGKYDDFMSVVEFLQQSQRNDITDFMHKVKKVVHGHIDSSSWYVSVSAELLRREFVEIRNKLRFNQTKSYALDSNSGKTYVSFDIQAANFAALRSMSTTIPSTWEEYLRSLVPNDIRSSSRRNTENGTAGLTVEIPKCLYTSKFFRLFLLGDLKKLKFIWELENTRYLEKICPFLSEHNSVTVNSDEIIVQVQDFQAADAFVTALPMSTIHRVTKFQITTIEGYAKNTILKTFANGTKTLMNADPSVYDELYTKLLV